MSCTGPGARLGDPCGIFYNPYCCLHTNTPSAILGVCFFPVSELLPPLCSLHLKFTTLKTFDSGHLGLFIVTPTGLGKQWTDYCRPGRGQDRIQGLLYTTQRHAGREFLALTDRAGSVSVPGQAVTAWEQVAF